ncbi:TetR/AcrR family transcriptional regulator [Bradyrhizobium sp. USDA 4502]
MIDTTQTRERILAAGLHLIDERGYEAATVAAIRTRAGVSNGSFFHFFDSKETLARDLFLDAIRAYHQAMLRSIRDDAGAADGVGALVRTHIAWVTTNRPRARFLFEQARSEWFQGIVDPLRAENTIYGQELDRWRLPLVEGGQLLPMNAVVFANQVIGPVQIFCRAWLSGRDRTDPGKYAQELIDCAVRAVVSSTTKARGRRR